MPPGVRRSSSRSDPRAAAQRWLSPSSPRPQQECHRDRQRGAIASCPGGSRRCEMWGGSVARAHRQRGAADASLTASSAEPPSRRGSVPVSPKPSSSNPSCLTPQVFQRSSASPFIPKLRYDPLAAAASPGHAAMWPNGASVAAEGWKVTARPELPSLLPTSPPGRLHSNHRLSLLFLTSPLNLPALT